ncbi:MAG: hypothetical protein R2699_15565 [Acidimicrobiales bacterium]
MTDPFRGRAAIVGVADAASPTGELVGTTRALEAAMVREALADAGLALTDVDGVFAGTGGTFMHSMELAEYLGIQPRWTDSTQDRRIELRGAVRARRSRHRPRPVRGGDHHLRRHPAVVVQTAADPGSAAACAAPRRWRPASCRRWSSGAALRHAHPDGRLCAGSVSTWRSTAPPRSSWRRSPSRPGVGRRATAQARLQELITIDAVLASPYEATPLHKLECCLVTDGAGAVVLTSAERAGTSPDRRCWSSAPGPATRTR